MNPKKSVRFSSQLEMGRHNHCAKTPHYTKGILRRNVAGSVSKKIADKKTVKHMHSISARKTVKRLFS
jgi:hypothetical protein